MHFTFSLAALASLSTVAFAQGRVCNNAAALCDRSYGNITHLGAHDSFSNRNNSNSWSVAADQFYTTLQQLDAGVRLVTAQVHRSSGGDAVTNEGSAIGSGAVAVYGDSSPQVQSGATSVGNAVATGAKGAAQAVASGASDAANKVGNAFSSAFGGKEKRQSAQALQEWRLCHSNCLLYDGGSLVDWLSGIKGWLDAHPNDVVTILLVNSDDADASTFKSIFETAGIDHYAYAPSDNLTPPATWPSLNSLIDQDKRLITFIADLDPSQNTVAPYLMNEFNFIFENDYDNDAPSDFSCQPNRPSTIKTIPQALSANYLPFMNHFLYSKVSGDIEIPDVNAVGTTNAATGNGSLGDTANACTAAYGRAPAFVLVDFFNVATPLNIIDSMNGVAGQTTGRLIMPNTVDAATATPSPTAYQTAAGAMADETATAQSLQKTNAASSDSGRYAASMVVGLSVVAGAMLLA